MVRSIVLAALMLPTAVLAQQGMSSKDFLAWHKLTPSDVEHSISMFEEGLSWANSHHARRGRPPIYCPSPNLVLTGNQLIDILRRYVEAEPRFATDFPWQLVLIQGLRETFPCKDQQPYDDDINLPMGWASLIAYEAECGGAINDQGMRRYAEVVEKHGKETMNKALQYTAMVAGLDQDKFCARTRNELSAHPSFKDYMKRW